MPPPPSPPDGKSVRLAQALRANLRRRKAVPPTPLDPGATSRVDDGVDGGEGLYPSDLGASGER